MTNALKMALDYVKTETSALAYLNEEIPEGLSYLQKSLEEALAKQEQGEPVALKRQLVRIHDALCIHLGDTDPYIDEDMTDEEICEEMPVFWAAKEIAALIGDAPWTDYTKPHPSHEPLSEWSVFNSGAEVASGLTYDEAMDYLTDDRLLRGWTAVCVVNIDNFKGK